MESFFADLPTINLPPISNLNENEEDKMSSMKLIQPLDLSRYQLPYLPTAESSQSHDRQQLDVNPSSTSSNLSLSPSQFMQNSHSAPPSAAPYQSSFTLPPADQRRTFPQQAPSTQTFPWLERGEFTTQTQTYESPYRPSPQPPITHIQHNHSHSTPNFFSMPLPSSNTSTPFQYPNSQLSPTPYSVPAELHDPTNDIPLPLQKNDPDVNIYTLPEGVWESKAPYAQPDYRNGPLPGKRGKGKNGVVKSSKHVCPVCDKRFNRPSSLNTHMAVHTGAKPYMCSRPDCQRRFSVSSNLRRHERTHDQRAEKERHSYDFTHSHPHAHAHTHSQPFSMGHTHSHSYSHPPSNSSTFSQTYFNHTHNHSQPFSFNYYQPTLPPEYPHQPIGPPASQFGSSSTSSTAGSSIDLEYGLAQYQVVATSQNQNQNQRRKGEAPRRGYGSMSEAEISMDMEGKGKGKAGMLLA
ncbi:hypothetical protein I302_101583 [Kwoniella bestiolae CBS 10118]|uniref:C2H2-type domain-containing protein n=1 Tax=Kwoniella bestiolae CBS 10118 TaxID=1296100 RepID=A0A1B9GCP0_9TREE|nr:hypothetical protein I302_00265 [Kwoniella bestiolae CBS 10118]OCF28776.1 hypothetical protein I302_00265 [Kwoniella bestiolae CBS 10118]